MKKKNTNSSGSRISIFVTILFPLLLSMIAIHFLLALGLRPLIGPPRFNPPPGPGSHGPRGDHMPPEVRQQMQRVASAALSADDAELAQLARSERVGLIVERGSERWTSDPALPSFVDLEKETQHRPEVEGLRCGRLPQFLVCTKANTDAKVAVFTAGFVHRMGPPPYFWITIALQIAAVLLFCYILLAWQLRPLRALAQGVEEVASGNFRHRLSLQGSREFTSLSRGFNDMSEKISRMMHAKEELVIGVSHELRSPLAAMKVAVELLDDEKRKTQLRSYMSQMESLVNELLETYRIGASISEVAAVPLSVAQVLGSLRGRYQEQGVDLEVQSASDLQIVADPRLLERLLTNLVDNAVKYSGSDKVIHVHADRSERHIVLSVSDRGPGIPEEDLFHVFEPFYRVDKSRNKATGGFGLGLYLCRKIAEAHGGTISAVNRPEGGCLFTIRLPVYLLPPPEAGKNRPG